jgi:hypothetical protein
MCLVYLALAGLFLCCLALSVSCRVLLFLVFFFPYISWFFLIFSLLFLSYLALFFSCLVVRFMPHPFFQTNQMTDEKGVEDPVVDLGDSLAVEGEFRDATLADGEDSAQWQASQEPASFVVMSEQVC